MKDDAQVFKLSNVLCGRPIDSDQELIYLSKLLQSPHQHCLSLSCY